VGWRSSYQGKLSPITKLAPSTMKQFQIQLLVLYGFLIAVAGLSFWHILSLRTNPFVSYLGVGRWFYLLLDVGAIAASALTIRALMLRANGGPRSVLLIACAVLVTYLGSKVLLVALVKSVPFYQVFGATTIAMSSLAVASIVVLLTKGFVDGYARGL
jgi:hypothetical protein